MRVSTATCDTIGADDSANTRWWLQKLAFDQLDSALENRFSRHFLRVCSTLLAAQRDVCDEWKTRNERETRVDMSRTVRAPRRARLSWRATVVYQSAALRAHMLLTCCVTVCDDERIFANFLARVDRVGDRACARTNS